mgnify:CR=1 FL=1
MKKVVCLIAVLALTAGVYADVVITAAPGTGANAGKLVLSYTADAGDELVGLAVVLDAGTGGDTIKVTSGWAIDSFFDVFIDAYKTDPAKLDDTTFGDDGTTPFADTEGPGQVTTDSAKVSLCLAALPADHLGKASSSELAVIDVNDGDADGAVTVCVTLDTLRGGPVDIEGAVAATIEGSCVEITIAAPPCFAGQPQEAYWVSLGSPECWCWPRQCKSDADDFGQGKSPYQPVSTYDLDVLKAAYNKTIAQLAGVTVTVGGHTVAAACADSTRSPHGKLSNLPVSTPDLDILKLYYNKATSLVTGDCAPGNKRAPWTNLP